jgi:putative transposase
MSRKPRNLQAGYSYHVTTRCNNREFKLSKRECREVFLYAINKALSKYKF